jgi:hypothetical protein
MYLRAIPSITGTFGEREKITWYIRELQITCKIANIVIK